MQKNDIDQERKDLVEESEDEPEHPAPGIEHHPEPDAENIMPAEDRPGTF